MSSRSSRGFLPLSMLLWAAVAPRALGLHETGAVSGRVRDDSGRPLPGVTVEVAGPPPASPRAAVSDREGAFRVAELPTGRYQVSFRLLGFATLVRREVGVSAPADTPLDVRMTLTATADVVVTGKRTFQNLAEVVELGGDLVGVADAASQGVVTARQLEARALTRPGDVLESVPGVVVSQHSGEGKANQYYLRGFNLDHGTDVATLVAGVPVNMPTHAHGQGYSDLAFLIPELVSGVQYRKGPYWASQGDFSAAGSMQIRYVSFLAGGIASVEGGSHGFRRALLADSIHLFGGHLLYAGEVERDDGPWDTPDDYRKLNGVLRFSSGSEASGFSISAMGYRGDWTSTDQIPRRAVEAGSISRFGTLDPSDGGDTHRFSLSAEWQRTSETSRTRASAYLLDYGLNLYSNFTYFLDDPENGDQLEQEDRRFVTGLRAEQRWLHAAGGLPLETSVGLEARNDVISTVGLHRTARRARLSTVRRDAVTETSGALYGETRASFTPWLRGTLGLRADLYRFHVKAGDPRNAGTDSESLLQPKLGLALGPFAGTELYASWGHGFHSNDARGSTITVDPASGEPASRVDPLVRARGAELGLRSTAVRGLQATVALWTLDLDSELLFVGDAGGTEASRPSRRRGVELTAYWSPLPWLTVDADAAFTTSRFRDEDPAGDHIPGAPLRVVSAGLSVNDLSGFFGSIRLRHFGERPLIEDGSVRSDASTLVNARFGYTFARRVRLTVDVLNVLDREVSDIDYFYASRLPGEPEEGVDDIHFHPIAPRSARVGLSFAF